MIHTHLCEEDSSALATNFYSIQFIYKPEVFPKTVTKG